MSPVNPIKWHIKYTRKTSTAICIFNLCPIYEFKHGKKCGVSKCVCVFKFNKLRKGNIYRKN